MMRDGPKRDDLENRRSRRPICRAGKRVGRRRHQTIDENARDFCPIIALKRKNTSD